MGVGSVLADPSLIKTEDGSLSLAETKATLDQIKYNTKGKNPLLVV